MCRNMTSSRLCSIHPFSAWLSLKMQCEPTLSPNGLFPMPDSDSDTDSCTMQDFSIGSDTDSDSLIEMYVIGTEICPWDRDVSLKWVQYPFGKVDLNLNLSQWKLVLYNTM